MNMCSSNIIYSDWHIWVKSVLHSTKPAEFCMKWKSNLMLYLSLKESICHNS
jgi:hypothetical protein